MKGLRRSLAVAGTILSLLVTTSTVHAAHESNSQAELEPTAAGPAGASGKVIVNYVAGREGWTASAQVDGLAPNATYNVVLNLNGGGPQVLCTIQTDATGSGSCSDQRDVLAGFNRVEIIEVATGTVVADGTFIRRGGGRERG